ncbi:hypothetical protein N431DRAFT_511930 [Stipitochalara longipes BDJ]|nr:hypothetical protein N431DRAFT_511930 [Stipitochalara longipes BDJ]
MAPRTSRSIMQDTWFPEILAILLSLISFLMILVLLKVYDNRPLFVWHGATLNTFVSTVATLGKALLLFTVSACMSQWKYIWFSQARRKLIDFEVFDISIGAVITILSLAIDPFVQQIVGVGERQVALSNSTTIARALRYSRGTILIESEQFGVKNTTNNTSQQMSTQYDSLYLTLVPGGPENIAGPEVVTYNLSNGLYLEDGDELVPLVSYSTTNRSQTVAFQNNSLLLYSLTVIKYSKEGGPIPGIPMIATECSLEYCVKNYTSEMSNGTASETTEPLPSIVMPSSWEQEKDSWGPSGTPGTLNTSWVQYLSNGTTVDLPDLQLGNHFNISQAAINSIAGGLSSVLAGPTQLGCTGFYLSDALHQPNSMQLIYDSGDLNTTFAGLATSMTNSIRSNDDSGTLVEGTVGITVYNVRLKWMSLPMIAVFGGFLLLALTVFYTHLRGLPIWKSSALSVMKVGSTTTNHLESETMVGGMEMKAKKTFIRLFSGNIGEDEEVSQQGLRSSERVEMKIMRKPLSVSSREISNPSIPPLSFDDFESTRRF